MSCTMSYKRPVSGRRLGCLADRLTGGHPEDVSGWIDVRFLTSVGVPAEVFLSAMHTAEPGAGDFGDKELTLWSLSHQRLLGRKPLNPSFLETVLTPPRAAYASVVLSDKPTRGSKGIHGAPHSFPPFVEHVGVDHGGLDAPMPQELLHGPDVVPTQQEMGGERMAQGVAGGVLGDAGLPGRVVKGPLHASLMKVVTAPLSGPRIQAKGRRGEDELPAPLPLRIGVFPRQAYGRLTRPLPFRRLLSCSFLTPWRCS